MFMASRSRRGVSRVAREQETVIAGRARVFEGRGVQYYMVQAATSHSRLAAIPRSYFPRLASTWIAIATSAKAHNRATACVFNASSD